MDFFILGQVLPTAGVHCVPAKLCSLQGTNFSLYSAQEPKLSQL